MPTVNQMRGSLPAGPGGSISSGRRLHGRGSGRATVATGRGYRRAVWRLLTLEFGPDDGRTRVGAAMYRRLRRRGGPPPAPAPGARRAPGAGGDALAAGGAKEIDYALAASLPCRGGAGRWARRTEGAAAVEWEGHRRRGLDRRQTLRERHAGRPWAGAVRYRGRGRGSGGNHGRVALEASCANCGSGACCLMNSDHALDIDHIRRGEGTSPRVRFRVACRGSAWGTHP